MNNEELILKGLFTTALMDKSKYEAQIKDIIKISVEKIYQSTEVIDKEIAGYQVINVLLNTYTKALLNSVKETASHIDKLIIKTLPQTFHKENTTYQILLNVSHFVASLSDSQAILQYKKINGFSL